MGRYQFLACDFITGNVALEVPLIGVTANRSLNTPGAFQASMPLAAIRNADGTPNLPMQQGCWDATESKRCSIAVIRDGTCLGEWRITSRPTRKNDGSPVQLEGEYITGYLAEVYPSWTGLVGDLPAVGYPDPGEDQLKIAWDLFAQCADPITSTTAPAGSRGLAISLGSRSALSSGVLVVQTDWPDQFNDALSMLTTLQQLSPGFDYDIDVALVGTQIVRTLTLSYPFRGVDAGITLLQPEAGGEGGQISDYEANEDGALLASQVITTGAGTPALVARSNNAALVTGFPLMQKVVTQSATTDLPTLQSQSDAAAAYAQSADVPPVLTILADADPVLGSYSTGDFVTVNIGVSSNYPYGASETLRITNIAITPPTAGSETVTLSVAVIP